MSTITTVERSLLVLIEYSNKLIRSPIKCERAKCFWEKDGITHFYDGDGQLYAIRPGNFDIRIGFPEATIEEVLIKNDFAERAFSDGVFYNVVRLTFDHTQ